MLNPNPRPGLIKKKTVHCSSSKLSHRKFCINADHSQDTTSTHKYTPLYFNIYCLQQPAASQPQQVAHARSSRSSSAATPQPISSSPRHRLNWHTYTTPRHKTHHIQHRFLVHRSKGRQRNRSSSATVHSAIALSSSNRSMHQQTRRPATTPQLLSSRRRSQAELQIHVLLRHRRQ